MNFLLFFLKEQFREGMKASVVIALLCICGIAAAYDRSAAVAYAKKWWNGANHDCKKGKYTSCTPYSYWGNEHCGYSGNPGDCANFVSQCLLAGGHTPLNQGGQCRGYPCGKEEVSAKKLGDCLHGTHGWTRTCGKNEPPPKNIEAGDVLIYHSGGCSSYKAHAVFIVQGGSNPTIACHSRSHYGVAYNYMGSSMPYLEWLHKN